MLWRLLKEYGFKQEEPWYKLEAKPVYENRSVKILWDPSILTDEEMTERKPDFVVEDRLCKSIYIIERSVPTDSNINGRWHACVTCLRISDFCKSSISAFRGVTFQAEVSLACDLRVKQSTSH